jgi:hypothetical protein
MSMSQGIRMRGEAHDRRVNWIVLAVVAVALLLGWFVRTAAEGRSVAYEVQGVRVHYLADWVRSDPQPPILVQVEDRMANGFRTTLTLQRRPLPVQMPKPLAALQQTLALERASTWTAYRELQVEESVSVEGRVGMHVSFAYVETNPNPFLETLPVVMLGEDYLFPQDNQAHIYTLTAAEANYARAQQALQAFIRTR